ncbi:MAG: helix-turn-helix domain-containing protein [Bacillota bacterium]
MSNFGMQLKKLRKAKGITQNELAKILGLAQTTIANYENNSRFPNQETLTKIADYFAVSLDYLISGDGKPREMIQHDVSDIEDLIKKDPIFSSLEAARKYFIYLIRREKNKARDFILKLAEERDPTDIYNNIFKVVLYKIGELWAQGKISIDRERYVSNTTLELIAELNSNGTDAAEKNYTIIGLAPYEERHYIGLKMVMGAFKQAGWNSIYFGRYLPVKNILNAIIVHEPDVLAFSITAEENLNSLKSTIDAIRAVYSSQELKIILGGYAAQRYENRFGRAGIDAIIKDIDEAVETTEKLVQS